MPKPLVPVQTPDRPHVDPATRRNEAALPHTVPDPARVALMLNRNARQVTDRLARRMERLVGSDHVFYSRSIEEAEAYAREIVHRGYGTVICGGGDGTLARAFNMVQQYVEESNAWRQQRFERYGDRQNLLAVPRFGFLRLGTGNALAAIVGARRPLEDVRRIVDYLPGRTVKVPMLESGTERFFFAGMGYDSHLLNDYNWVKERFRGRVMERVLHGLPGYFGALAARTLPGAVMGRMARIEARVTTRGRAYYVDPRRGDAVEELPPGEVLFDGRASLIAAGTTPYYGYGLRIFPFARMMPGMMQLRIATLGPVASLAHLPSIWRGSYRNAKHVLDFLVEDAQVELSSPYPFQHSGDGQGLISALDLRVAAHPLELVDLHPPRRLS